MHTPIQFSLHIYLYDVRVKFLSKVFSLTAIKFEGFLKLNW